MNLFDVVPKDLFSILASPNRAIYANALEVLHDAYRDALKIPEATLYTMLRNRLEDQLEATTFEDEDIEEDERANISGKARFLIRKMYNKGWFQKERGKNFDEYIIVPEYSSALLDLFYGFTHETSARGFSYVFGTYSTLKTADETDDVEVKMMAIYSAYDNISQLTKLLKKVYHNVNRFFQLQMDMKNVNEVLATHFYDFGEKIMEIYIRPLKIKDSAPKYRESIYAILDKWLDDEALLQNIAKEAYSDKREGSVKSCHIKICNMIFEIKAEYNRIEKEYLSEIDDQVRRYTRATTQKIENLTNKDQNTRGNLNYLLSSLSENKKPVELIENINSLFEIYEQSALSSQSLWHRKKKRERDKVTPLPIEITPLDESVENTMKTLFRKEYSKKAVNKYINDRLENNGVIYSKDIAPADDYHYVLSLLSVLNSTDKLSAYEANLLGGELESNIYQIPQLEFKKKENK